MTTSFVDISYLHTIFPCSAINPWPTEVSINKSTLVQPRLDGWVLAALLPLRSQRHSHNTSISLRFVNRKALYTLIPHSNLLSLCTTTRARLPYYVYSGGGPFLLFFMASFFLILSKVSTSFMGVLLCLRSYHVLAPPQS